MSLPDILFVGFFALFEAWQPTWSSPAAAVSLFEILSLMGFFFFVFVCLGSTVMLSMAIPSFGDFLSPLSLQDGEEGEKLPHFSPLAWLAWAMVYNMRQGLSLPSDVVRDVDVLVFDFAMVVGNDDSRRFGFIT
jgi:hypothetical protein